ncbi:MAG TPA: PspA/IM30 family protein [Acidobacteriaceae bacterium]|nr:PspA/IM30 family protein [Acidobacteriaceae bacterium]
MALLERVGTLLRANVNDLIDKAEDPQKLLRQLVLDMENQLMQVKTQVAIAIADQHLLEKKQKEHTGSAAEWRRKAELAVSKGHDDLARAALERSLAQDHIAQGFAQQLEDQHAEADSLRTALRKLDQKLVETRSRCDLLIAQERRARVVNKATAARQTVDLQQKSPALDRMKSRILSHEAQNAAHLELLGGDSLEDRFAALEREEHIESLLKELKEKQNKSA